MMRRLVAFSILLLIAASLRAEWRRTLITAKGDGEYSDVPPAHSFSYFREVAVLRDDNGMDGCSYCSEERKTNQLTRTKIERKSIGMIRGHEIIRLDYHGEDSRPFQTLLLAKDGEDRFHEFLYWADAGEGLRPAMIARASDQQHIVWTALDEGGHHALEFYGFWFDANGVYRLDMKPILQALERVRRLDDDNQYPWITYQAEIAAKGPRLVFSDTLSDISVTFTIDKKRQIVNVRPDVVRSRER